MILAPDTNVNVETPGIPNFGVTTPTRPNVIVAPVAGPPGLPGSGSTNDSAVAAFMSDHSSATYAALAPVVESTVEPPVDLVVLLENNLI